MCRGGVDDAPPAFLLHAGNGEADGVKGRRKVDRDDLVPFLDREFLDRRNVLNAGIVDEDVDRAELLIRLRHHPRDRIGIGHVGGRGIGLDLAFLRDVLGSLRILLRITQPVDHHIGPLRSQRAGDGEADPGGASGHEGGLSCKAHDGLRVGCGSWVVWWCFRQRARPYFSRMIIQSRARIGRVKIALDEGHARTPLHQGEGRERCTLPHLIRSSTET